MKFRYFGFLCAGFLLAGFSEILSPLFALGLLLLWTRNRQATYLATVAGLALGTLIVIAAPGNAIRQAALPARTSVIVAAVSSLKVVGLFLVGQGINHPLALVLAFAVGYLCPLKQRPRRRLLWAEIGFLVALGLIYFTVAMANYFVSGLDARHFTTASLVIVSYVGLLGVLCAEPLQRSS